VMAPGFFARQDTATPVKIAAVTVAVNVALTVTLGIVLPLAQVGIALATSVAGWVNALSLVVMLRRRGHFAIDRQARRRLPRIALAALGMGVLLVVAEQLLAPLLAGRLALQLIAVAALIGGGLVAYALLAFLFGAADWRDVKRRLRR